MFPSPHLCATAVTTPLPGMRRDSTPLEHLPSGPVPPSEHAAADICGSGTEVGLWDRTMGCGLLVKIA